MARIEVLVTTNGWILTRRYLRPKQVFAEITIYGLNRRFQNAYSSYQSHVLVDPPKWVN